MSLSQFPPGTKVFWIGSDGTEYLGTVTGESSQTRPDLYFEEGSPFQKMWGFNNYRFTDWNRIKAYEPPEILSPKERVDRKIKLLWNNSNWVKQNPQRAY